MGEGKLDFGMPVSQWPIEPPKVIAGYRNLKEALVHQHRSKQKKHYQGMPQLGLQLISENQVRSFKLEHQILVNISKLSQNMMVANFPKVLHALSALSQRSIHAESGGMSLDLRANRSKSQTTNYT
jgi:predicted FMN-binding regulatory protein PaiB